MVQAIRFRNFDEDYDKRCSKTFQPSLVRRNKRRFFCYLAFVLAILLFKHSVATTLNDNVYKCSQLVPILWNSSSDFLFVFHLRCLSDHMKYIRHSKKNIKEEILNIIDMKRSLHRRHSINLTLNIYSKFLGMIFEDNKIEKKEKLIFMLWSQQSDFVVGKTVSLQLLTLISMVSEVANYFIYSIQLFMENPYN
ncbi:CLUMA_CG002705, isoform A [Clunio marinus]|uniref:CLUMA_CG002705, isoform A n=1 Tax=Clunio marinus TaxID=568069 RepID=A0A1J1HKY9_9DIPT|nr:CLUMA_CG002705, isoform A [Clunio marinus]